MPAVQRGAYPGANAVSSIEVEDRMHHCTAHACTGRNPRDVALLGGPHCWVSGEMGETWGVGQNRGGNSDARWATYLQGTISRPAYHFLNLPTAIRCTNLWCERRCESAIREVRSIIRP